MVEVHDLHIWSLTPGITLLAAHVYITPEADAADVLCKLVDYCRKKNIGHTTFQLVVQGDACPCMHAEGAPDLPGLPVPVPASVVAAVQAPQQPSRGGLDTIPSVGSVEGQLE